MARMVQKLVDWRMSRYPKTSSVLQTSSVLGDLNIQRHTLDPDYDGNDFILNVCPAQTNRTNTIFIEGRLVRSALQTLKCNLCSCEHAGSIEESLSYQSIYES